MVDRKKDRLMQQRKCYKRLWVSQEALERGVEKAETCRKEDKVAALIWLVREVVKEGEPTIVFASTRHHVEFLHTVLQAAGMNVTCVYGAMDQVRRWIEVWKCLLEERLRGRGARISDSYQLCAHTLWWTLVGSVVIFM